jgi:site-specific DNA-methyltransferase (adenine-specific)
MSFNLMHGDCLEMMKLIPDGSVDMVLADIPYNEVNRKSSGLRNLNKGKADFFEVDLKEMILQANRVCKGTIYIFCGIKQISEITEKMQDLKLSTRLGQWEKTNPSPMNGSKVWLSGSEFCVIGRKPNSTFNEHCQKPIWKFSVGRNKLHPTQKPIALMERLILASSNRDDTVLDFTMGSGTTGVACVNTARKFIGIELDQGYFDIAKERIVAAASQDQDPLS